MRRIYRKLKRICSRLGNCLKKKVPVYIPVLEGEFLKGRMALITGGTGGIGYSIADAFIRNGANVVITGRSQERIDNSVISLSNKYPSAFITGIVMDNSDIGNLENKWNMIIEKIETRKIDILVNNAGVLSQRNFHAMTEEDYDIVLDTNLKGTFFLTKLVTKYMISNKIRGNILNVASSSSLRPAISPYTLSKWGLRGFTLGLAKALSEKDIVVNGIAPGPTVTPMLVTSNVQDITRTSSPNGRFSMPEEIANLSVILVSELGRTVVGDTVYATGGCGVTTFDDIAYNF